MNLKRELKAAGIDSRFLSLIINRLSSLGYEVTPEDDNQLYFNIIGVEKKILSAINRESIPPEMQMVFIDSVCGDFLSAKKNTGGLGENFDFESVLKSIKQGDTDVSFAEGDSAEDRFNKLLIHLQDSYKEMVPCYRQLKW